MSKEKMVLKIMIEPKEIPCHDCVKGCMGDEFMRCKKLKAHNKKITAKEYDYDKAIEVIKKSLKQIQCWPDSFNDSMAEAVINALLEGGKNEQSH